MIHARAGHPRAGEVSTAAVETTKPLSETVHGGAFRDQRIEAEVGADLNGLRGYHDSRLNGRPFVVGIDDRADCVQSIHPIQRPHSSRNQVGGVPGSGKRVMRLASAADAIHHDAHASNSQVDLVGTGDRPDDLHHGSRQGVVIPYRNEFRRFSGFDPPLQLLARVQIRGGIQLEALGVAVAGRRRHLHDCEAPRQRAGRQRRDLGKRFCERDAQVHLVENHEAIIPGEPGVHWPHTR